MHEIKTLRKGYTTGACAAAAAKAAAKAAISGELPEAVEITLPRGEGLRLAVVHGALLENGARCAVKKDAGDDPDVTNGVLVYATVTRTASGLDVTGGEGIGRVTKPGLQCAVGEYAINRVPRAMIEQAMREACDEARYHGGLRAEISIPAGVELAKRTYNPRLGIVGGISVLGTTGVVEPMSERALVESIQTEMDVLHASGETRLLLVPGNYGEVYARDVLGLDVSRAVLCSNFIGDVLDYAVRCGFTHALLVGGLGKLVKLAGGIFNTHSHHADCRMELLTAHAALAGADRALAASLMACVTTDEALCLLRAAGLWEAVEATLLSRIAFHLDMRVGGQLSVQAVLFSEKHGPLGCTAGAKALLESMKKTEETV